MCAGDYVENCFFQLKNQMSFDMKETKESKESFSENEILEQFLGLIKKKMRFSIIDWGPTRKEYPQYIFLSGDKGILAYVDFKYIESEKSFYEAVPSVESKTLLETLRTADSQLDRPIFFVYMLNCRDRQGIYFETNEQIKDRWFKSSYSDEYYVPVLEEMGNFNNLIDIWNDLKKNNVRV